MSIWTVFPHSLHTHSEGSDDTRVSLNFDTGAAGVQVARGYGDFEPFR